MDTQARLIGISDTQRPAGEPPDSHARLDVCSSRDAALPSPPMDADFTKRRMKKFGELVSRRRRALRLSQRELARQSRTAANAISQLESGKRNMSLEALVRVLGAMGLELTAMEATADSLRVE